MKKLKLLLFTILSIMCPMLSGTNVLAETDRLYNGDVVNIPYYYTHHKGSSYYWDSFRYITRASDGGFVYCIQPLVHINTSEDYDVKTSDLALHAGIDESTWKRLESIAYYGYGYKKDGIDHSDAKWYAATQMMIWQLADPSVEAYFTHTIRGQRDDAVLADEISEINALVDAYTKPNLDIPERLLWGEKKSILNKDGDMASYQIKNTSGGKVTKVRNYLVLEPDKKGTLSFTLSKKRNYYNEPPKLYYSSSSQKALARGDIDPLNFDYKVVVDGKKVILHKRDYDTGLSTGQGDGVLKGAVYGIFKSNGTKIAEVTTDDFGNAESDYLSVNEEYYFQELKASKGYEIDPEKHYFTLDNSALARDNSQYVITVREQVKKREFTLFKVFGGSSTGKLEPEVGISFDIYLKTTGEKITTITTDTRGLATITLPFGTYIVKQLNAPLNYEKVEDFEIVIDESSVEPLYMTLANNPIKAHVKLVKKDSETHEIIKSSKIRFKIKNLDTGGYVCQNITYPTSESICEFETNELGEFYTPFELLSGHYQIEELDQPLNGYTWNKEPLKFEIGENSEFKSNPLIGNYIELTFYNDPVKASISITKKGEILNIKNGRIEYSDIDLKGVVFYLRAKEDIVFNNKLFFKKGELVQILETDELGYAESTLLPLGKYTLEEISSNLGNVVDKNIYDIEFTYDNQYIEIVTKNLELKNYLPKGTLEFSKLDFSNDEPLPNTLIEIYTENDLLVFSDRTDNFGKITIDYLPIGKYYIVEREAPDGYKINEEKMSFEIEANGEVVKAIMKDERIDVEETVKVPDTFKIDYRIPLFTGILIICLGVIIFIYGRWKK